MKLFHSTVLLIAFVLVGANCTAQDDQFPIKIKAATYNTAVLMKGAGKTASVSHLAKDGPVELPFVDDFSRDHFAGNTENNTVLWLGRQATLNNTWAVEPPTIGVVSFDGTNEFGYPYDWDISGSAQSADTLTSVAINCEGTAEDNIGLSFYYQPGGLGDAPNPGGNDSLILEFYAPELDQWFWVWSVTAGEAEPFEFVYIPIVQEQFLKEEFQFRFRNYSYLQGALDVWHVDYVWLDRNSINENPINNDVAFVEHENSLLAEYTAMPVTHFAASSNPSQYMKETVTALLRNLNDGARTLEGNKVRILYEGEEVANLINSNSPSIAAQSTLEYTYSIASAPNNFVFPHDLNDTAITFEVQFIHEVSDFVPTAGNDTMRFNQEFSRFYAYDDGSAELMQILTNTGTSAAMRFVNQHADSLWGVQIYTMPGNYDYEGANFTLKAWAEGAGAPGEVIASKPSEVVYGVDSYQQQIVYPFDEPVYVPQGIFYVGYTQTDINNSDAEGLGIGLDMNTASNSSQFYFGNSGGSWFPQTNFPGTMMVRPLFKTLDYSVSVEVTEVPALKLYPNPASDRFKISFAKAEQLNLQLFDISGKMVLEQRVNSGSDVSVSSLTPGIYIVKLSDVSGRYISTSKLSIQ